MNGNGTISILVADSNSVLLRIVSRFLREQEARVVGAARGAEEALAQAEILRPDVVLIDLTQTYAAGLDAISRLRTAMPKVGIIATTTLDVDGYRQAALAAGADELVSKDRMSTALVPAIRRARRFSPDLSSPQLAQRAESNTEGGTAYETRGNLRASPRGESRGWRRAQ